MKIRRITDSRGRLVEASVAMKHRGHLGELGLGAEAAERVVRRSGMTPYGAWFGAVIVVYMLVMYLTGASRRGPFTAGAVVYFGVMAGLLVYDWRWRLPRADPRRLAAALVRESRCGACGYSLEGLAPEADGCLVCAECGAAWRLPVRPCSACGAELDGVVPLHGGAVVCEVCGELTRRGRVGVVPPLPPGEVPW